MLISTSLHALSNSAHWDTRVAKSSKQGPRQNLRDRPVCHKQEERGQRSALKQSVREGLSRESDSTTAMPQHSLCRRWRVT